MSIILSFLLRIYSFHGKYFYEENEKDDFRARNLYEAALRKWQRSEPGQEKPDDFTYMEIMAHLARVEKRAGNFDQAIQYLELLKRVSPSPVTIQEQIDQLKKDRPSTAKP